MRFERPLLQAIVAQGKLSDPEAERYLVDTLIARRDAIGRTYLDAVSPLDDFRLDPDRLCMSDLSVRYGFAPAGTVEWLNGDRVAASRVVDASGRLCVVLPRNEAYTIFRMRVRRSDGLRPAMEIHFVPGGSARILGLIRVAE